MDGFRAVLAGSGTSSICTYLVLSTSILGTGVDDMIGLMRRLSDCSESTNDGILEIDRVDFIFCITLVFKLFCVLVVEIAEAFIEV